MRIRWILAFAALELGLTIYPSSVIAKKTQLPPVPPGIILEEVSLHAADGTTIFADWYRATARRAVALVIAPGYIMHKDQVECRGMSRELSRNTDVLCLSLRGHGKSHGTWTHGEKDYLDVLAGICEARREHDVVRVMGFSMGAAAALRACAACSHTDPLALVSPPVSFRKTWLRPGIFLSLLGANISHGTMFSVRQTNAIPVRSDFREDARRLQAPTLVILGERDRLIPVKHSRELFDLIPGPKELVIIEKAGHAESIYKKFPDRFIGKIAAWMEHSQ